MEKIREVIKITGGKPAVDGAGVKLVRVIGFKDTKDYDPFLMLDAFDSREPADYIKGFPWHPHRGIETITYLIKGDIEHGDSLGNSGSILDGECQWMTAGSGIIHQEMPQPSERMLGAQLWLNLPAKDKMTKPLYGDIKNEDVPVVIETGASVRIVAGEYKGKKGAFEGKFVKASYLDIELTEGTEWTIGTEEDDTLFIYIFYGKGYFGAEDKDLVTDKQAVLFSDGNIFRAKAADGSLRFILMTAKPLREPVAWGGPIVMNTREELDQAFKDLDNNTFIKN